MFGMLRATDLDIVDKHTLDYGHGDVGIKRALAQIYVRSAPYGCSDKSSNGHRYASIPFANGMIKGGMTCQLIHYTHEEHGKLSEACKGFKAIVVRCNPGQIKADGGDQAKRRWHARDAQGWHPSLAVPGRDGVHGIKGALCKVAP